MYCLNVAFFLCSLCCLSNAQFVKQQHTLVGPYDATKMNDWFLAGSAKLHPEYIELTNEEPQKRGGLWNVHPVTTPDWEVQMQFHVHGTKEKSYGNGIAFWYVKESLQPGPVFGSKDFFSGLGIFIDTSDTRTNPHKHHHPYISAMVNNGSIKYVHDEEGTNMEIGNCYADVRNKDYITRLAISYIENTITVYLDAEGSGLWTQCFVSAGVHLPIGYNLGITAGTGDHGDNHAVISITGMEYSIPKLDMLDRTLIIPRAENFKKPKDYVQTKTEDVKRVKVPKIEKREASQQKEQVEKQMKTEDDDVQKEKIPESPIVKATLLTKCIYFFGSLIIIILTINTCHRYCERKRVSREKRLY